VSDTQYQGHTFITPFPLYIQGGDEVYEVSVPGCPNFNNGNCDCGFFVDRKPCARFRKFEGSGDPDEWQYCGYLLKD
jgi:hypothetical protein